MKRFLAACAFTLAMVGAAHASVNLNRATEQQLQTLKGIGPAKAHAIVVERQTHGAYRSLQDLQTRVPGIGAATVSAWGAEATVAAGAATPAATVHPAGAQKAPATHATPVSAPTTHVASTPAPSVHPATPPTAPKAPAPSTAKKAPGG